jgi:hypothetical protein
LLHRRERSFCGYTQPHSWESCCSSFIWHPGARVPWDRQAGKHPRHQYRTNSALSTASGYVLGAPPNLRVVGSIPTRLTKFHHLINRLAGAGHATPFWLIDGCHVHM